MLNVLQIINQGVELFEEATAAYERAKTALGSIADPNSDDLTQAKERLDAALARARQAHDDLDSAIASRLGEK